jgi:hypothetical protein
MNITEVHVMERKGRYGLNRREGKSKLDIDKKTIAV